MSRLTENNVQYRVTYLTGHLHFKEPEWKMKIINPTGLLGYFKKSKCILSSEFCSIQGDLETIAKAALEAGIRFRIENE